MPVPHRSRLALLLAHLKKANARITPPPVRDPFQLLIWEQLTSLPDDAIRLAAFRLLELEVGTTPEAILRAPFSALRRITQAGGATAAELRAKRVRFIAERTADQWDGNLWSVVKLPYDDAVRELMRYPSIGLPAAERILLLTGTHRPFALEGNGVRVLLRLGFGRERGRHDKTYASVQQAAAPQVAETQAARISAHFLLRAHGESICKRVAPACGRCAILHDCPVGKAGEERARSEEQGARSTERGN